MTRKLVNKFCQQCNVEIIQVSSSTKLCDKCKKENRQRNIDIQNKKQKEENMKKSYEQAKHYILEYTKDNGKTLTPNGFNEISPISASSIIRSIKGKTWVDILRMFEKEEKLKEYIKDEYLKYLETTNKISFAEFTRQHEYLTYEIINSSFNMKELLNYCGRKILRNEINDYKDNFDKIKNKLGHIPLHNEFQELTKISLTSYINTFGLKGKVYNNIVKMYTTENEYNEYLVRQKEHKSEVGKQTCNIGKSLLTLEDLEIEFRKVFDNCFKDTGKYPSRRLFNKLSKHNDKTYRKKLNMKWTDICKSYGYPVYKEKYIFENYVLKHISKILMEEYKSQKTFTWLKGINNFPLFCDGYFPIHNLIVEVDGRQHRKPYSKFGGEKAFKTLKENDKIKDSLIPQNGIKLLRIADNTNWHDVKYLRSRLEEVLDNQSL